MTCLVDTNIISELARPTPNAGVIAWAQGVSAITISAITAEEIYYGLSWKPNPRVLAWFESFINMHCQILDVCDEIARHAGQLRGSLAASGQTRTQADMLIAATAQHHRLTLVTRNVRDFEHCGIALLNPFS